MGIAGLALVLWTGGGPNEDVRRAVEKSLPYLEKKGVDWINNRKCASCHHVPFLVWSHREAQSRGLAVDSRKLDEWTAWAVQSSLKAKSEDGRRTGGGLDTMAQIILARPAKQDDAYRELAEIIRGLQKPEGFWEAGGQLPSQRRPLAETHEVSTLWVLHSFRSLGTEDEPTKSSREKALNWIRDRKPGKSGESLALHLLTSPSDALRKDLLARQNQDGGWGWLSGEESDAFATGQILYVLGQTGGKDDPEPARRAAEYLVRTQREDGSWLVRSTKPKSKDVAISSYWGTAWAAIGLVQGVYPTESPSSSRSR